MSKRTKGSTKQKIKILEEGDEKNNSAELEEIETPGNDEADRACGEELLKRLFEKGGIAKDIENQVHENTKTCNEQYRNHLRRLFLDLSLNKELAEKIKHGEVKPEEVARMSSADMAHEERRAEDELIRLQCLKKTVITRDEMAETDQFKCGKCKQRKTTYYQLQTRSADEPMTTFVSCIVCGNRWKFS
ncbi:MAG: transcription elongation factor S-II [Amphiamblys sp. WSBS2006]|nr:MAG: transcription elongation factor S-II [Amphiamblys sp. WSBS2006]